MNKELKIIGYISPEEDEIIRKACYLDKRTRSSLARKGAIVLAKEIIENESTKTK